MNYYECGEVLLMKHSDLLKLKRWNTPTVYNGWEQITNHDRTHGYFNLEEVRDFMPQMGPMIGYAVTVTFESSKKEHIAENPRAWEEYRQYVASMPGPKIVVLQDLDKPEVIGSFWGEINSNIHKTLGCVGTITDGAVRDLDEMANAGFKAIAKRLCVGHGYCVPVSWGCEVEVFGCKVRPGDLIHADKHGFLIIPEEDQAQLLDAVIFMDNNECGETLCISREGTGKGMAQILQEINEADCRFRKALAEKFR
jgi:4-hydroxy-4-methyl-2-oxoglutarate aldolase